MKYSKGYDYQTESGSAFPTSFHPAAKIVTQFITLEKSGLLVIVKGYAWDGPSGFTYHDKLFILISLPHDALYQLMRMGLLPHAEWRKADLELKRVLDYYLGSILDDLLDITALKKKLLKALWAVRIIYIMAILKAAKGQYAHPDYRKVIYEVAY